MTIPIAVAYTRSLYRRARRFTIPALVLVVLWLIFYSPDLLRQSELDSKYSHLLVTTPGDTTHPFHLISVLDPTTSIGLPLPFDRDRDLDRFFPTHIIHHPTLPDVFYVLNEVSAGEVMTVQLVGNGQKLGLRLLGRVTSGGEEPAYGVVTRDGKYLIVVNYNSPTISLYSLPHRRVEPLVPTHIQTLTLPSISKRPSRPHQIVQHSYLDEIFYVPDQGNGMVWLLRLVEEGHGQIGRLKVMDEYVVDVIGGRRFGKGPRHGVVSKDGTTFIVAMQDTSNLLVLPLDPLTGRFHPITTPTSRSTLPRHLNILNSQNHIYPFALSDVMMSEDESHLYVANRRVIGPFAGGGGGGGDKNKDAPESDVIAIFPISSSNRRISKLTRYTNGHPSVIVGSPRWVPTGCFQPREMLSLGGGGIAVTCVGGDGERSGVVVLGGGGGIKGMWEQGPAWGLVGAQLDDV